MKRLVSSILATLIIFNGTLGLPVFAEKKASTDSSVTSVEKEEKAEKKKAEKPAQVKVSSDYSSTDTVIKISWEKIDNVSGYRLYKKSDGKWETVKNVSAKTKSYRFKNLNPATTYKFKVQAFTRTDGDTLWGKESAVIKASTKPSNVELTVKGVTQNSVTVQWDSIKCSGYELYQKFNNGYSQLINSYDSTIKSVTINCPNAGQKYEFEVRAYKSDGSGKKVYSKFSSVEATTEAAPAPEPEPIVTQPIQQYSGTTYILNTSTKCYHRDSNCRAAKRINPENYATSNSIPAGYTACGICAR